VTQHVLGHPVDLEQPAASRYETAAVTARSCASVSSADISPPATAYRIETLFGAENVRSIAATVEARVIRRSCDPSTG
jgi:hypothetical protein